MTATLQRRQRAERLVPSECGFPARLYRLYLRAGLRVEVRIARDRRRMAEEVLRLGWKRPPHDALAAVHWWHHPFRRRGGEHIVMVRQRVLGTLMLNARDLRRHGAINTIAHESTHLAMLVMRCRGLDAVRDEEPLANLVGEFAQQISTLVQAHGIGVMR